MSEPLNVSVSHFCICTDDLDRSASFYAEGLGFELEYYVSFTEPFEVMTQLPGVAGRAGFFNRNGVRIELLVYDKPGTIRPPELRPLNMLGLTHLSLVVDDLDAAIERIESFGGQALTETRISIPQGEMMFCTDPNGTRIELWEKTA